MKTMKIRILVSVAADGTWSAVGDGSGSTDRTEQQEYVDNTFRDLTNYLTAYGNEITPARTTIQRVFVDVEVPVPDVLPIEVVESGSVSVV